MPSFDRSRNRSREEKKICELGGRNPLCTERAAWARRAGRTPPKRKIRFYLSSGAAVSPRPLSPNLAHSSRGPGGSVRSCGGRPRAVGTIRRGGRTHDEDLGPDTCATPLTPIIIYHWHHHHHHYHHYRCGPGDTVVEASRGVILSA